MERTSIRAWRRLQKKRVWRNRLRRIYRTYAAGAYVISSDGEIKRVESWLELRREKWCQPFRTTGRPCSCPICAGERYNRIEFKRDTRRIISLGENDELQCG